MISLKKDANPHDFPQRRKESPRFPSKKKRISTISLKKDNLSLMEYTIISDFPQRKLDFPRYSSIKTRFYTHEFQQNSIFGRKSMIRTKKQILRQGKTRLSQGDKTLSLINVTISKIISENFDFFQRKRR